MSIIHSERRSLRGVHALPVSGAPNASRIATGQASISYGESGTAAAAFGHVRTAARPFNETLERLRAAIAGAGFWVLHEIDPQAIVARGGYQIGPVRQLLFFHPDHLVRVLTADPSAVLEAPLKIAAMAMPDGSVAIRWTDPAPAFARYGHPDLAELGQALARSCTAIVADALGE